MEEKGILTIDLEVSEKLRSYVDYGKSGGYEKKNKKLSRNTKNWKC